MKKLLFGLVLLVSAVAGAADSKVTALTEDTTPTADDLLYTVDSPGGAPASKKATIANVVHRNIPPTSLSTGTVGSLNVGALTGTVDISTGTSGNLNAGRVTGTLDISTGTSGNLNAGRITGTLDISTGTSGNLNAGRLTGLVSLSTGITGSLDASLLTGTVYISTGTAGNLNAGRLTGTVDIATGTSGNLSAGRLTGTVDISTGTNGSLNAGRLTGLVSLSTGVTDSLPVISLSGSNLPGGSTSYIQNSATLQSGATAFPDYLTVGSSITSRGPIELRATGEFPLLIKRADTEGYGPGISFYNQSILSGMQYLGSMSMGRTASEVTFVDPANNNTVSFGGLLGGHGVSVLSTGTVKFYDLNSSNYVAFKGSSTIASDVTWVLPAADGSATQVLATDGAGVLYFKADATGAGGTGSTIFVEDGGSTIVETSTMDFTGSEFTVSDNGGDALVAIGLVNTGKLTGTVDIATGTAGNLNTGRLTGTVDIATGTTGSLNAGRLTGLVSLSTGVVGSLGTESLTGQISLSTGVTGSLPAASIAAGNLGSSVMASSVAAASFQTALTAGTNITLTNTGNGVSIAASGDAAGDAVVAGTQTWTGLNTFQNTVTISTAIAGLKSITWSDGTIQVSSPPASGGASLFTYTFNPDQAKLPGANPCVISNSTLAVTSSLLCDASTDESVTWSTTLTPHPSGTLKADVYYSMVSATSGDVILAAQLMCVTSGDSADLDTESFATAGTATDTVPGTAGYLDKVTITPTDDSCAAGDVIVLKVYRDADAGGDTATGDVEIRKARLYAE